MPAKHNILLIEDDTPTRELYQEILQQAGYTVTTAVDGNQGLAQAQQGGFSLILLDVILPKKDGLAILAGLKNKPPKTKNGPILLLTNLAHDPVIQEALNLGAKAHLVKADVTPDQLLKKIKAWLK